MQRSSDKGRDRRRRKMEMDRERERKATAREKGGVKVGKGGREVDREELEGES